MPELNEELEPYQREEIRDVVHHLLDGGAVMYLDHFAAEEDEQKLREFVEEELRGSADD